MIIRSHQKSTEIDFLMDHRHLWLRSRKQMAIMQIRNAIIYASYEFFDRNGFIKFDSPILSGNAAEDSTELFETDYFGTPAFLSQSGQLVFRRGAMALGRVFDFGPVFPCRKIQNTPPFDRISGMMDADIHLLPMMSRLIFRSFVKALIQGVSDRVPCAWKC